jgi:hypothetical protein
MIPTVSRAWFCVTGSILPTRSSPCPWSTTEPAPTRWRVTAFIPRPCRVGRRARWSPITSRPRTVTPRPGPRAVSGRGPGARGPGALGRERPVRNVPHLSDVVHRGDDPGMDQPGAAQQRAIARHPGVRQPGHSQHRRALPRQPLHPAGLQQPDLGDHRLFVPGPARRPVFGHARVQPGRAGTTGAGQHACNGSACHSGLPNRWEFPFSHQTYLSIFLNGVRRGLVYTDSQHIDSDYVRSWWPDDDLGANCSRSMTGSSSTIPCSASST